ncbi:hypothetical protein SSBG_04894 [Streptomyces sp. SPB074]|nr:hypothetical protein SSBG_04894 [Streptomyces sp. SPB074]
MHQYRHENTEKPPSPWRSVRLMDDDGGRKHREPREQGPL